MDDRIALGKENEAQVMRYVEWHLGMYRGKSPAIRQMARTLGFSMETIVRHLRELDEKGYIKYNPKKGRTGTTGITLTDKRYFTAV